MLPQSGSLSASRRCLSMIAATAFVAGLLGGCDSVEDSESDNPPEYAGSAMRILIHGSYCHSLEGFMVKVLDVRFGCKPCKTTAGC